MREPAKATNNLLVLTHWSYKDALVQAYTLPYVRIIRSILPSKVKIVLVTSEQRRLALSNEELLAVNKAMASENIRLISTPYVSIGMKKFFYTTILLLGLYFTILKNRINTIHCFCTPAGSIGYLLSKLTGADLIIDSYEPHAETMIENGTWTKRGLAFRLLFFMEKLQTQHAKCLIGTSNGMLNYARERYNTEIIRFFVKPACVDLKKFNYLVQDTSLFEELKLNDKIVCVYAGKLGGIYLKEEIFDFLSECHKFWGDRFRFLMLTNASTEEVSVQIQRVNLPTKVVIQRYVPHNEVQRYLTLGTFALNPVKPVPTKRYCTSIKDGEYWASGLPIVITRDISDDSGIISDNDIGYVLNDLTAEEYRLAIKRIDSLIHDSGNNLRVKIRAIAENYRSFKTADQIYSTIYSRT